MRYVTEVKRGELFRDIAGGLEASSRSSQKKARMGHPADYS